MATVSETRSLKWRQPIRTNLTWLFKKKSGQRTKRSKLVRLNTVHMIRSTPQICWSALWFSITVFLLSAVTKTIGKTFVVFPCQFFLSLGIHQASSTCTYELTKREQERKGTGRKKCCAEATNLLLLDLRKQLQTTKERKIEGHPASQPRLPDRLNWRRRGPNTRAGLSFLFWRIFA